jgi:hypothetical protein
VALRYSVGVTALFYGLQKSSLLAPRQLSLDSLAHKLSSVAVLVVPTLLHKTINAIHNAFLNADDQPHRLSK